MKDAACFEFAGVAVASIEEFSGATDEILAKERQKAQLFIDIYGGKIYDGYQALIDSDQIDAEYLPLPPGRKTVHDFVEIYGRPSFLCSRERAGRP